MTGRPDWDEYFLGVAEAVAKRGDCTRSQVGAVLVDDRSKRILSTGYNGVERGRDGCLSGACPRGSLSFSEAPPYSSYSNCIATHAEANCVEWWRDEHTYTGSPTTIYISRRPCDDCQELLRAFNVGRAVFRITEYPTSYGESVGYLDLTPWKGM